MVDAFLVRKWSSQDPLDLDGSDFVHKDHLGSTRLLTTAAKAVFEIYDYQPYGEMPGGGTATTHKFTGKERDDESGLDDFGARSYASQYGRFMSADSPFIDQHPGDPQSWNLFAHVRNNPLKLIDPMGNAVSLCQNIASCQPMENSVQAGPSRSPRRFPVNLEGKLLHTTADDFFGEAESTGRGPLPSKFWPLVPSIRPGHNARNLSMMIARPYREGEL